jgi:hypothetical protein
MRKSLALYFVVFIPFLLALDSANAAQPQGSPALSAVIQEANKEGKLKLSWGEGTLGGTKRMALYEQLMNKMFGSNVKIGFTPGPSMPAMGVRSPPNLPPVNRRPAMFTSAPKATSCL